MTETTPIWPDTQLEAEIRSADNCPLYVRWLLDRIRELEKEVQELKEEVIRVRIAE